MEGMIGEIRIFAGAKAPNGWKFCDGQRLSIGSYGTLYGIIRCIYGGDNMTYFCLPDLRGRVPLGVGHGKGLTNRILGESKGEEGILLGVTDFPAHSHKPEATVKAYFAPPFGGADSTDPTGRNFSSSSNIKMYTSSAPNVVMAENNIEVTVANNPDGGKKHENMQPFTVINYIICFDGNMPVRPS